MIWLIVFVLCCWVVFFVELIYVYSVHLAQHLLIAGRTALKIILSLINQFALPTDFYWCIVVGY